jgi:hypothetical protein
MISPIFDLSGAWTADGQSAALFLQNSTPQIDTGADDLEDTFTVDMSNYAALFSGGYSNDYTRPPATCTLHSPTEIDINFPDDQDYTAILVSGGDEGPDTIQFSNGSSWSRVPDFWGGATLFSLEGRWAAGGVAGPFIGPPFVGSAFEIDMSFYNGRGPAPLDVPLSFGYISAHFIDPADQVNAFLRLPRTLSWSNGSSWTWVPPTFSAKVNNQQLQIEGENYPALRELTLHITAEYQNTVYQVDAPVTSGHFGEFVTYVDQQWNERSSITITVNVAGNIPTTPASLTIGPAAVYA